jgi:hypothetical protein
MSKLEEILRFSSEPKQVAKYFNLFSSHLMDGESIERIEIEVNLTPKALIITNFRIVECKPKSFGTDFDILFYVFWDSLTGAKVLKGIISDDFEFKIGNSNVIWKCEGYDTSSSMDTIRFILMEIESKNKISQPKPDSKESNVTINSSSQEYSEIEVKLEKIQKLFDKKLISEQEYLDLRKNVLIDL